MYLSQAIVVTVAALVASCDASSSYRASSGNWTNEGSPYVIRKDLHFNAQTPLTIEAGVEVQLGPGVQLYVNGGLVARGTESRPIRFTSIDREGDENRWGSLLLHGAQDTVFTDSGAYLEGSILERVKFERATNAISLDWASPLIRHCEFSDNKNAGYGGAISLGS